MKRIITLMLAAALVLGSFARANATDVKVYGMFQNSYGFVDGSTFRKNVTEDDFRATIRLRAWVEFIASEALKGVYAFEVGNLQYGQNNKGSAGAQLDTSEVNLDTRFMYIDWLVPNTKLTFRMGLQNFGLPAAMSGNNPVHSGNAAGVVGNYKFNDTVSLTAFWFRPFDEYGWSDQSVNSEHNSYDSMDMFGLVLPLSFDGFTVTPWAMYSSIGNASGYWDYRSSYKHDINGNNRSRYANSDDMSGDSDMWSGGISASINLLDPLSIKFDGMYSGIKNNGENSAGQSIETGGWWLGALLEYKLDWGTPGIVGWWASGDDADAAQDGDFGRLATIGVDDGVTMTSFGMYGNAPLATGNTVISTNAVGTWGAGARVSNLSVVKDLSHTIGVYYMQGTNNSENGTMNSGVSNDDLAFMGENIYMTTADHAWEVDLTNAYQIYENFTAYLELGYINLDMDKDVWGNEFSDNAWKGQLSFEYKF